MRRVAVIVITAFETKDPLEAGNPHCVLSNFRDVSFLLQGHLRRYLFSQQHLAWAAESTAHLARGRSVDLGEITFHVKAQRCVSKTQPDLQWKGAAFCKYSLCVVVRSGCAIAVETAGTRCHV